MRFPHDPAARHHAEGGESVTPDQIEATLANLDALDQPDQPRAYDLRTTASALGITYDRIRGWVRNDRPDRIATLPTPPGTTKLVHIAELKRLARAGWPVNPEPLIDAD